MKRILAILFTAAMMTAALAITSFAATDVIKLNSLHFNMDTSSIDSGSDPDSFDKYNVHIECLESSTSNAYYKTNLSVSIDDVQMTSPKKTLKVGDTAQLKVWVYVSGSYDGKDYVVTSSTKPHVTATGGGPTIKSTTKSRSGNYEIVLSVTTNAIKGDLDAPENLEWKSGSSLGQAKWSEPESGNGSGVYDIRLRRDDKTVVTFTDISGKTMNFYPWMTKEGDYTFEVRSIPKSGSSGAKKSDWAESDSQWVDEKHVSDGTGQYDPSGTGGGDGGNSGGKVGWVKNNNTWYYYYPDGTMRKNGWEKVNNKWYYFDASGAMKTGWQTVNGNTYYLDTNNGDMKTGWVNTSDGQWYYLNPNPAAGTEGAMFKNQWLNIDGQTYFLKDNGAMATGWLKIDGKFYYFNPNSGGPKGSMMKNVRIDSFYLGADGAWVQGA